MCIRCDISRRSLLVGGAVAAASLTTGVAQARIRPQDMVPLIGPGFSPTDKDEQGLWKEMERAEEEISGSNLLIQDPKLTGYLKNLIGKVGGPAAQDFRIYLARIPEFNAMMFPSGFAVVFTGLLLRMRNEAQLAGVIAHESGHFLRRHMIRSWRDQRRKTDIFAIGAMLAGVGGAGGRGLPRRLRPAGPARHLAVAVPLQPRDGGRSRRDRREADRAGRLRADRDVEHLAAADRRGAGERALPRKRRDRGYDLFATHPAPEDRHGGPQGRCARGHRSRQAYDIGRERYLSTIGDYRQTLLDDQVKLNDPGASEYLIQTLALDGWNGLLRFYEGEVWRLRNRHGDDVRAAQSYAAAVVYPDAPADAWRWHGISLMKAGRTGEAKAAFARYLTMKPDAPDAAWVRQMMG